MEGVFPLQVLPLVSLLDVARVRTWMDEHIKVAGPTVYFKGELIDDNLNSLTWWTDKHRVSTSREALVTQP